MPRTGMGGLMMDVPLTVPSILRRASRTFPEKEIVSRQPDGSLHRTCYGELRLRVARLMNALRRLGVGPGDRVATFAGNHHRHLELYFAVPGIGAVLHTVNIRLHGEQTRYIINHARDRVLFVDASLAGPLSELAGDLGTVTHTVVIGEGPVPSGLHGAVLDDEELLASASGDEDDSPIDDAMAAGLCYTSGTTGRPKGVLYSHRSIYLHALACCTVDAFAVSERETVLPVVPMFHINAWWFPFSCTLAGAKQVYAGTQVLGRPLAELIEAERVTMAAGVPSVWTLLHRHLLGHPHDLSSLKVIYSGGAAVPRSLIEAYERDHGVALVQAWGMTEMSSIGTAARPKARMAGWARERRLDVRAKQGLPVPGVDVRIVDDEGRELPWDGRRAGELHVRGPWIARAYYEDPAGDAAFTPDGWFRTGDVATIDADGYVQITDRIKDLIKSKGEWISSVDLENALLEHPEILEAAVVAGPDPRRDEVPVAFVVPSDPDAERIVAQDVQRLLARRFATWQVPRIGDIHVVAELPKTGVGKLDKKVLRRMLAEPAPAPHLRATQAQPERKPSA